MSGKQPLFVCLIVISLSKDESFCAIIFYDKYTVFFYVYFLIYEISLWGSLSFAFIASIHST